MSSWTSTIACAYTHIISRSITGARVMGVRLGGEYSRTALQENHYGDHLSLPMNPVGLLTSASA